MSGRFPRRERLPGGARFQALFQQGKRVDRPSFIVLWRDSPTPRAVGFAVSRQLRDAVRRNRARRRLREAYRVARDAAPVWIDVVVIARARVLEAPFAELVAEMREAFGAIPGGGR